MRMLEIPDEIGPPDPNKITEIVQRHCMGFTREQLQEMVLKAIGEKAAAAKRVERDEAETR